MSPLIPHTLRTAAVGATAALALTACGSESADTGKAPAPQGVVSKATAKKVADRYEKVNNKANAAQDEKLLGTVEAGQVYAMDKAVYTLFDTWPKKDQKDYAKPFSYQDRTYVIPKKGTGDWFAVQAKSSENNDERVLLVFDKVDGTYKMVLSLWAAAEDIPKPALDKDGLAKAVDPGTKIGGLAPTDIRTAYADYLETGGKKKGKALTSTQPIENAKKTYQRSSTEGAAEGKATEKFFAKAPADPSVYALRTADGGVLALLPLAHKQESLLKESYRSIANLVPNDEQSALGATSGPLITDTFEGQGLAELTPKAARLTNVDFQHVDAR
ncbi:hypothetical protein OG542_12930 [Streptomyces violaceus]|uniref:hypothetical protein n=1 Tax=Streptomyces violaceus TaxID=1936 RepID=UPI002E21A126